MITFSPSCPQWARKFWPQALVVTNIFLNPHNEIQRRHSALRDKKYTIKALSPSISIQDSPWHRSTFLRPFSVVDVAVRFILAATVISKQKYKIMPSLCLTTVQARLVSAIGGSDLTVELS